MKGIPTRYGNFPAQWKAFWDQTGGLWMNQSLAGKLFGTFVSTGVQGGGQELTAFQSLSVPIHHGMIFVPIGYKIGELTDLNEVHGGSPWGTLTFSLAVILITLGAGTYAGLDGSRNPTTMELGIAKSQGKLFAEYVKMYRWLDLSFLSSHRQYFFRLT
jgi:NAD(P)H dehydrogenase (quinone)